MKARLPWILLALSLALNVFFVGGFVWTKTRASAAAAAQGEAATAAAFRPAERLRAAAKELGLDPAQRAALETFVRAARQNARHLREQNQPLFDAAWAELAKANPDEAVLNRAFDEGVAHRRAYQAEMVRALREFLATLSDEQRAKALELMRRRPEPGGGGAPGGAAGALRRMMP
jgi:uncharacterized membrane protein